MREACSYAWLAVCLALGILMPRTAAACSCAPADAAQRVAWADVVVRATPIIEYRTGSMTTVAFEVHEIYKGGELPPTIDVVHPADSSCRMRVEVGSDYFLIANRNRQGVLSTGPCNGSRLRRGTRAAPLREYLEGLPSAPPSPRPPNDREPARIAAAVSATPIFPGTNVHAVVATLTPGSSAPRERTAFGLVVDVRRQRDLATMKAIARRVLDGLSDGDRFVLSSPAQAKPVFAEVLSADTRDTAARAIEGMRSGGDQLAPTLQTADDALGFYAIERPNRVLIVAAGPNKRARDTSPGVLLRSTAQLRRKHTRLVALGVGKRRSWTELSHAAVSAGGHFVAVDNATERNAAIDTELRRLDAVQATLVALELKGRGGAEIVGGHGVARPRVGPVRLGMSTLSAGQPVVKTFYIELQPGTPAATQVADVELVYHDVQSGPMRVATTVATRALVAAATPSTTPAVTTAELNATLLGSRRVRHGELRLVEVTYTRPPAPQGRKIPRPTIAVDATDLLPKAAARDVEAALAEVLDTLEGRRVNVVTLTAPPTELRFDLVPAGRRALEAALKRIRAERRPPRWDAGLKHALHDIAPPGHDELIVIAAHRKPAAGDHAKLLAPELRRANKTQHVRVIEVHAHLDGRCALGHQATMSQDFRALSRAEARESARAAATRLTGVAHIDVDAFADTGFHLLGSSANRANRLGERLRMSIAVDPDADAVRTPILVSVDATDAGVRPVLHLRAKRPSLRAGASATVVAPR